MNHIEQFALNFLISYLSFVLLPKSQPDFNMYDSHFSIDNIPYGIASKTPDEAPSVVTRLLDTVVFLDEVVKAGLLLDLPTEIVATFNKVRRPHILAV